MCGISAIYILDKKGRVLISRHFRPDLPTNIYDVFNKKILEYDEYTLKYPKFNLDLLLRTRITIYSTSIGITIWTLLLFQKKTIMQWWFLPFCILLSTCLKVTSRMSSKSPLEITSLLFMSCLMRWWTMATPKQPRLNFSRDLSKLNHMNYRTLLQRSLSLTTLSYPHSKFRMLFLGDRKVLNIQKTSFS